MGRPPAKPPQSATYGKDRGVTIQVPDTPYGDEAPTEDNNSDWEVEVVPQLISMDVDAAGH
eukprot:11736377-Heterocapsa_arctica.AAC.1